jgi:hypothetical protein
MEIRPTYPIFLEHVTVNRHIFFVLPNVFGNTRYYWTKNMGDYNETKTVNSILGRDVHV